MAKKKAKAAKKKVGKKPAAKKVKKAAVKRAAKKKVVKKAVRRRAAKALGKKAARGSAARVKKAPRAKVGRVAKPTKRAVASAAVAPPSSAAGLVPPVSMPATPRPIEAAPPKERAPRFFEPDDMPSATEAADTILENGQRDRPFYDTDAGRTELDEEVELVDTESESEDFDDEGTEGEDDDEDEGLAARERPPPVAADRGERQPGPSGAKCDVGQPAPEFALLDERGQRHTLSQYRGRKVVLYFYPKDDTPGCTREACGFRDTLGEFDERNAVVLGVSPDPAASHASFVRKYGLTFPLLVDEDHAVAARYGVWGEKAGPGGSTTGILRTTFVIDEVGRIVEVFRGVRPDGHEHQVLSWLDKNWLAGG